MRTPNPIAQLLEYGEMADLSVDRVLLLIPSNPRITGERDLLEWDLITEVEKDADATRLCLSDFLRLANANADDILRFVGDWGLLDWGTDAWPEDAAKPGCSDIADWREAIRRAEHLLHLLVATEGGELIQDQVLSEMASSEHRFLCDFFGIDVMKVLDELGADDWGNTEAVVTAQTIRVLARWGEERRKGRGLEVQRGIASLMMNEWMSPLDWAVVWDSSGRHMETVAYGVRDIVGAHLLSIFSAHELDVFICSVCGNLYDFAMTGKERRPRKGRRSLCSDNCSSIARRADNRAAWHRNKSKWSKKGNAGVIDGKAS